MRLSVNYQTLRDQLAIAIPYMTANAERLGITADQLTSITARQTAFVAAHDLYLDPETHTPRVVHTTETEYLAADDEFRGLQQQMKNNRALEMTDADYDNTFTHRNADRRGRRPTPTVAPANTLLDSKRQTNTIETYKPVEGDTNHRRLDKDVARVGRKVALINSGDPVPTADDYHSLPPSGYGTFTLTWQPEQRGKVCYLITWFENYKGEPGPESAPLEFQII